jgi:hypothetical protein
VPAGFDVKRQPARTHGRQRVLDDRPAGEQRLQLGAAPAGRDEALAAPGGEDEDDGTA